MDIAGRRVHGAEASTRRSGTLPEHDARRFIMAEEQAVEDHKRKIALRRPYTLLTLLCEKGKSLQERRLKLLARCSCRELDLMGKPARRPSGNEARRSRDVLRRCRHADANDENRTSPKRGRRPQVLTKKDVAALWRETAACMRLAGLAPVSLDKKTLDKVIAECWTQLTDAKPEGSKDEKVTFAELRAWCAADLGKRGLLTKLLAGNVRGTLAHAAAVKRGKRAGDNYRFDGGRATMRFERALKRNPGKEKRKQRESVVVRDLRKKFNNDERAVQMALREKERLRKRKLHAIATTKNLTDLVIESGVKLERLMQLRNDFADILALNEAEYARPSGHLAR